MKILFLSRADLYNPRGGDTLQMQKTKEYIEKVDPTYTVDISTEVQPKNIKNYDLVHVFNIDWVCETYMQVEYAKRNNKKVVISAIHHSESEVRKYEDYARYDIRRIYNRLFPSQSARDMWKNVYRSIFCYQKIVPTLVQLFMGIRNQQKRILEMVDLVLVQTDKETESLIEDFGTDKFTSIKVVNGVDTDTFIKANPVAFEQIVQTQLGVNLNNTSILLNVGRIEPRKNQLALMSAFTSLQKKGSLQDWKLVFIGDISSKSYEYKLRFKLGLLRNKNILYLGYQPQNIVASAMSHKGIYVHPSWFETTGLVCLEALLAGMPVVTSTSRLSEYVKDGIEYCQPESNDSIQNAILKSESEKIKMSPIVSLIQNSFSWEVTAKQTIQAYKKLIN